MILPTFYREKALFSDGAAVVIGCDEVGRGCLAGPVVAAAVVMPRELRKGWKTLVRDSKTLSQSQRERAAEFIREHAVAFAVGEVDAATIDRMNIHHASLEAMRRAAVSLLSKACPEERGKGVGVVGVLVDGKFIIPNVGNSVSDIKVYQQAVVGGDAKSIAIAAASIIAKVHRDALMTMLETQFPAYGFAQHKGYATAQHRSAILVHGLTVHHRRTFCKAFL